MLESNKTDRYECILQITSGLKTQKWAGHSPFGPIASAAFVYHVPKIGYHILMEVTQSNPNQLSKFFTGRYVSKFLMNSCLVYFLEHCIVFFKSADVFIIYFYQVTIFRNN